MYQWSMNMSDFKSKLPDLNEISSMAGKLFKDIKTSVCEIVETYKAKHPPAPTETKAQAPKTAETSAPTPPPQKPAATKAPIPEDVIVVKPDVVSPKAPKEPKTSEEDKKDSE